MDEFYKEMCEQCGKPIKGFEQYGILENGVVCNNWNGNELKPDRSGRVCIKSRGKNGKRKTFSIARLVALNYLEMPDDPNYMAYLIDPDKGFAVSNVGWGSKHDVLSAAYKQRKENKFEPEVID